MKGKTTITLSRENVKDIITDHVRGNFLRPIEVTGIEVHRNGSIEVEFKHSENDLPLAGDGEGIEP